MIFNLYGCRFGYWRVRVNQYLDNSRLSFCDIAQHGSATMISLIKQTYESHMRRQLYICELQTIRQHYQQQELMRLNVHVFGIFLISKYFLC